MLYAHAYYLFIFCLNFLLCIGVLPVNNVVTVSDEQQRSLAYIYIYLFSPKLPSWNSNTLAASWEELTYWKRLWCCEGLGAGGEGDDRGWDGWMASLTRWTWVWVNSGSWWWTGRPGVLWFMGSQRVGHDWATELNWNKLPSHPGCHVTLSGVPCAIHLSSILTLKWSLKKSQCKYFLCPASKGFTFHLNKSQGHCSASGPYKTSLPWPLCCHLRGSLNFALAAPASELLPQIWQLVPCFRLCTCGFPLLGSSSSVSTCFPHVPPSSPPGIYQVASSVRWPLTTRFSCALSHVLNPVSLVYLPLSSHHHLT